MVKAIQENRTVWPLTTNKEISLAYWVNAYDLGCPELKYSEPLASWIALEEDPCLSGKCGKRECPNYLNGFDKPERLILIPKQSHIPIKVRCPKCDSTRVRIVYKDDEGTEVNFYDCTICSTVFKGKPQ